MTDRHYAGVYWEDRRASKEDVARDLLATLTFVRSSSPLLARWHLLRASREESLADELTEASTEALVAEGIVPCVVGDPDHGWRVRLWNGLDGDHSARLELTAGAHLKFQFAPAPNALLIHLPRGIDDPAAGELLRREPMVALLGQLARTWNADWGVVSTDDHMRTHLPHRGPHYPRVGWLTFLHDRRGRPAPRANTRVESVDGLGIIVGTEHDRFTTDDSDVVCAMEDALEAAGVIEPTGQPSRTPSHAASPAASTQSADPVRLAPSAGAYRAALEVAVAVDALADRIPVRRRDLADSLLRAATALVVVTAAGGDATAAKSEVRALVDLSEQLMPGSVGRELERARDTLTRA